MRINDIICPMTSSVSMYVQLLVITVLILSAIVLCQYEIFGIIANSLVT